MWRSVRSESRDRAWENARSVIAPSKDKMRILTQFILSREEKINGAHIRPESRGIRREALLEPSVRALMAGDAGEVSIFTFIRRRTIHQWLWLLSISRWYKNGFGLWRWQHVWKNCWRTQCPSQNLLFLRFGESRLALIGLEWDQYLFSYVLGGANIALRSKSPECLSLEFYKFSRIMENLLSFCNSSVVYLQ